MYSKFVVTGATGFLGSALFQTLSANPKYTVKGLCRTLPEENAANGLLALGNLETADFSQALAGVDVHRCTSTPFASHKQLDMRHNGRHISRQVASVDNV